MLIEHTAKGTVITITEYSAEQSALCTIAEVHPTKTKHIKFKVHIEYLSGSKQIMLIGRYKHFWCDNKLNFLNCDKGGEGSIMLDNKTDGLVAKIGSEERWGPMQNDTCVMRVDINGRKGTRIVIKRLQPAVCCGHFLPLLQSWLL